MPIYEYRCEACGHEFEKLQKISDPAITECPICHKNEVKKLISAAAFRLKGGGWYETDFKKDGKRNLAGDGADKASTSSDAGPSSGEGAKTSSETKTSSTASTTKPSTTDKVA